jgi:hypothetical protein
VAGDLHRRDQVQPDATQPTPSRSDDQNGQRLMLLRERRAPPAHPKSRSLSALGAPFRKTKKAPRTVAVNYCKSLHATAHRLRAAYQCETSGRYVLQRGYCGFDYDFGQSEVCHMANLILKSNKSKNDL